ncbi:hypothetical protein QTN25_005578 [Entamoeba marina]
MEWISVDPQILYLKVLHYLLRNESKQHLKKSTLQMTYSVYFENKIHSVTVSPTDTVSTLLKMIPNTTQHHSIDSLLALNPIYPQSKFSDLAIPTTQILYVIPYSIKEDLSNRKDSVVKSLKPLEQISDADVGKIIDVCSVSSDIAAKALQMYHTVEKQQHKY